MNYKYLIILFTLALTGFSVSAQEKKDSLKLLKDFITISNAYQQAPLYLKMEVSATSNIITDPGDTLHITGEFYLQKNTSYIRFGEMEQVVNDSLALIVSEKEARMLLYTSAREISAKWMKALTMQLSDSSLSSLAAKYKAEAFLSGNTATIGLKSRQRIPQTDLYKEELSLTYDPETLDPTEAVTTRRTLVRIDSSEVASVAGVAEVIQVNSNYFLIKETVTVYRFLTITHNDASKVPVLITDRIYRSGNGEYVPLKSFSNYQLIQH